MHLKVHVRFGGSPLDVWSQMLVGDPTLAEQSMGVRVPPFAPVTHSSILSSDLTRNRQRSDCTWINPSSVKSEAFQYPDQTC
jgi:hypothetical protein